MEKFKVIAITGFTVIMNMACSPNGFNSLSSSSTSSSTLQQLPDISQNQKSCTLSLQNSDFTDSTKVNVGEKIKLKLNTNFEIPENAKVLLLGDADIYSTGNFKPLDLSKEDLKNMEFLNSPPGMGSGYNFSTSVFKRQIVIIQNDQTLCASNTIQFEFASTKDYEKLVCLSFGGQLKSVINQNDTCHILAVDLWQSYINLKIQNTNDIRSISEACSRPGGSLSKFNSNLCIIDTKLLADFTSLR